MVTVHNFSYGLLNPVLGYAMSCLGAFLGRGRHALPGHGRREIKRRLESFEQRNSDDRPLRR